MESCQYLLILWMKVLTGDVLHENGNGNYRMSYLPNNCTSCVSLPCPSTLVTSARRALFSTLTTRNSVWPASMRERKDSNSATLMYCQLDDCDRRQAWKSAHNVWAHWCHACSECYITHGKERRHNLSSSSTFPILKQSLLADLLKCFLERVFWKT